jgi:hypothetical protein
MSCLAVRYWNSVREVAGPGHVVFGSEVLELG